MRNREMHLVQARLFRVAPESPPTRQLPFNNWRTRRGPSLVPAESCFGMLSRMVKQGKLMVWSAADPTVQLGYKGRTEEGAMELFTLGIDLGKTTFHLVGMNQHYLPSLHSSLNSIAGSTPKARRAGGAAAAAPITTISANAPPSTTGS